MSRADWASGYVQANGIRLHYERTDPGRPRTPGATPTVVMAHGITDAGLCWSRVAEALETQFDVVMVDARGHGQSDKPAAGYTSAAYRDDLAGLIQALELDSPILLGHSLGARTAVSVAGAHPDRVAKLVLEDPPWRDATPQDQPGRAAGAFRDVIRRLRDLSQEDMIARGRKLHPGWDEQDYEVWAQSKRQVADQVFDGVNEESWRDTLSRVACPTLLITGDVARGGIVSEALAREAAQICPLLQICHVSGAGHNVRRENFPDYLDAIRGFLA